MKKIVFLLAMVFTMSSFSIAPPPYFGTIDFGCGIFEYSSSQELTFDEIINLSNIYINEIENGCKYNI